jgi:hypothetical protein
VLHFNRQLYLRSMSIHIFCLDLDFHRLQLLQVRHTSHTSLKTNVQLRPTNRTFASGGLTIRPCMTSRHTKKSEDKMLSQWRPTSHKPSVPIVSLQKGQSIGQYRSKRDVVLVGLICDQRVAAQKFDTEYDRLSGSCCNLCQKGI